MSQSALARKREFPNPSPADIRAARKAAGMTQPVAGALLHSSSRAWQQWEAGDRRMHPALWELFTMKLERLASLQGHDA